MSFHTESTWKIGGGFSIPLAPRFLMEQKVESAMRKETMKTVIEYKTATAGCVKYLGDEVNKLLREGFQPFGSPYLIDGEPGGEFCACQAMVRFSKDSEEQPASICVS